MNETESVSAQPAGPVLATAEDLRQAPVSVAVLKRLLESLSVAVQPGLLQQACARVGAAHPEQLPARWLGFVFHELQLRGLQPTQLRWNRFDQRKLPALLRHAGAWWLVERDAGGLLKLTGAEGQSDTVTNDELEEAVVLWVRKAPEGAADAALADNDAARMVIEELFRDRRWLHDVAIATIIVNLLAVTTSLFSMQVYDRVVPTLAYATLATLVAGMLVVTVLDWVLKIARAKILDSVACAVDKAVSQRVFEHLLRLQLDARPRSLGTLAAQVGGLETVRQFFTSTAVFALVDMPFALLFIVMIAVIGGHIGWVYFLMLPLAGLLGWTAQRRMQALVKNQITRSNERQGMLVDVVQGTESIRASNAAWRFAEQWQEITRTIAQYNIRQKALSSFTSTTTGSLSTLAYVLAIVVGVFQVEAGHLTTGAMVACSILGGRVIAPISQSIQYLAQWESVAQSLQMVNRLLQQPVERTPGQNLLMPEQAPSRLALEQVAFTYPESPVKQVNVEALVLNAGDRICLLGNIGSGKSTLLKILAGLYRPGEGRVRLGDADLWEIEPSLVADHVGYLPQKVDLFKGTLRSNLVLAGAVSDSHLLQVAAALGIDRIAADSPQGMDLPISEGGDGLSGGQRQLLGLGRLFLGQPRIWLLDEPTASLDSESEMQVLAAIERQVQPTDILVIATHRPFIAARLCNRVLVMQRGKVVADGPPEKLMPNMVRRAAEPAGPASPSPAGRVRNEVI